MSAIALRILVYAIIAAILYFGIRSILIDWRNKFRQDDEDKRQRDLKERERPDVIDLKRDNDGVFRPGENKSSSKKDKE